MEELRDWQAVACDLMCHVYWMYIPATEARRVHSCALFIFDIIHVRRGDKRKHSICCTEKRRARPVDEISECEPSSEEYDEYSMNIDGSSLVCR
jgi:hypothetical protein